MFVSLVGAGEKRASVVKRSSRVLLARQGSVEQYIVLVVDVVYCGSCVVLVGLQAQLVEVCEHHHKACPVQRDAHQV